MNHFISHKGFHWEYEMFGHGDEMLLAFHGFGNHASDFETLEPALGKRYKIISFNLPYHGTSRIDDHILRRTISKDVLKELFQLFLHQHRVEKFSLMGYSLGGKIVLQLTEFFPEQVNAVFLFAPDGIRYTWSNGFVTRNAIGKRLYQRVIKNPTRFFNLVKMLQSMNLIHEKISDFLQNSLDTKEKRQLVWDVWICFRDIKPNISKIQELINEHGIRMHLFFGKYDRIVPPAIGRRFAKRLKDKHCLHVVDLGHNLIREKMNLYLQEILN